MLKRWMEELTPGMLPEGPSAVFAAGSESQHLAPVRWADGPYVETTLNGEKVVQSQGPYLYFKIDDEFAHFDSKAKPPRELDVDSLERVYAVVTLYDGGKGSFVIQHDAHPQPRQRSAAASYTTSRRVNMNGTGTWREVVVELPRARLANGENGGADFRLSASRNYRLHVRKVVIRRVPFRSQE
jgi:hypothetical protein